MSLLSDAEKLKQKLEEELEVTVRIALFGQPGAGKSSLINALVGQHLAPTGVVTDKTTEAEKYEWNGMHLVDLPGYDTEKFPADTYFDRFDILSFDLFLCVYDGKFRAADGNLFRELRCRGKTCLFVRNKQDNIWERGRDLLDLKREIAEDTAHQVRESVRVYFVSCKTKAGVDKLSQAIWDNLDGAKQLRYVRAAKAYTEDFLEKKRKACLRYVIIAAGAAAANGLNPIPGLDIAVDISTLLTLFSTIRKDYGLTDEVVSYLDNIGAPILAHLTSNIVKFATKEGLIALLKKYGSKEIMRRFAKYVPYVGQAVAATTGFAITLSAGKSYLKDCHEAAEFVLNKKLDFS